MSLPLWAKPGEPCICIDDAWKDVLGGDEIGSYPVKGGRYVIALAVDTGELGYVVLGDLSIEPDYYQVDAFRPLTQLERDLEMFSRLAKDAGAPAVRELEPA